MQDFLKKILPYASLLLILALLSIFFYSETIANFPSHIHAWTQSDRYALALGFIDNQFNFFLPQMYNLVSIDGVTGVDFPIHEYLIAGLMKILGSEAPIIFRLYTLLYCFLGYCFLYRLSFELNQSYVKSFGLVLFIFSCPILSYYQAGFIPSSTSFATALMAYYFYFKHKRKNELNSFYFSIALMCLAALCRTPFNIFLFALLLQELIGFLMTKKIIWKKLFAFCIAYGFIVGFFLYKNWLNQKYGSQFLTILMPAENINDFLEIIKIVIKRWAFQLFTKAHYILLFAALISIFVAWFSSRKMSSIIRALSIQTVLVLLGAALYFVLMAEQYKVHEYYFIDSFYLGFVLLFLLGISCFKIKSKWIKSFAVLAFLGLIVIALLQNKKIQILKYSDTPLDRCETTRKNFTGSAAYLDELGISRDARVLVIDAYSTNLPLILLDRKGYTVLRTNYKNIKESLKLDVDFIVIQDVFLLSDVVFNYPPILRETERIGGNGKVSVFKLKSKKNNEISLREFIGVDSIYAQHEMNFKYPIISPEWTNVDTLNFDSLNTKDKSYFIDSETTYGPTFSLPFNPSVKRLLFNGNFYSKTGARHLKVVVSIDRNGETIYYEKYPLDLRETENFSWRPCLFFVDEEIGENAMLKCYLWNPEGEEVYVNNFEILLYDMGLKSN